MNEKEELIRQTKRAFDFIQKLYMEVSYMFKEVEGVLLEEEEKFVICRPQGYAVAARSSVGLEPAYIKFWMLRKMAVSFVPEENTSQKQGKTHTLMDDKLKTLYLRVILDDKEIEQPVVHSGIFYNFTKKSNSRWDRYEHLLTHIEYNEHRVFTNPEFIDYEDMHLKFKGRLIGNNLYDLNSSEELNNKVIKPMLELFRNTP